MLFGEEDDFEPEITTHGSWIDDEEESYWSDHWYYDLNPEEAGYVINEVGDLFYENDLLTYDLTDLIESKAYFRLDTSDNDNEKDIDDVKTSLEYLKNHRNYKLTKFESWYFYD